jgi:hypothetical protein
LAKLGSFFCCAARCAESSARSPSDDAVACFRDGVVASEASATFLSTTRRLRRGLAFTAGEEEEEEEEGLTERKQQQQQQQQQPQPSLLPPEPLR